jgi:hypothetical protein
VRLRIVPGSACATLERGWWRTRVLANVRHLAEAPQADTAGNEASSSGTVGEPLAELVDATFGELAQSAPLKGARLEVELADSLVHLDVVCGDFAADSERQLEAVAGACVAELLGEAAKDHEVRWQLQSDGRHLLIGAVAHSRLQALSEAATRHRLLLRSVQPDFCLQWNRHARVLKSGAAVFAVASGRDAVVARVSRGTVCTLSGGPWLDRFDAPGTSNARAQRLMCGFGLEPTATAGALEIRVDRMLTSAGSRPEDHADCVLVAPRVSVRAVAPRWKLIDREAIAP